jgi:diguanylate cyclase (GGDEF)-like protein
VRFEFTPSLLLLAAVVPLSLGLAWHAWRNRSLPGALPFAVIAALAAYWSLTDALELAAVGLRAKLLWADLEYVAIAFIPVVLLVMALDYTGRQSWLTRRNLLLLCVIPLVSLVFLWTNSFHQLMRSEVWLDTTGSYAVVGRTFGTWFWVHTAYSYLTALAAAFFLLKAAVSAPRSRRGQPAVLLLGLLITLGWNMVYVLAPSVVPRHDFTPALFGVAGIIVAWGLFRFRLFTLVPIARRALMDNMKDGLLVLDETDRVVDLNEAARRLIDRPAGQILAQPLSESWGAWAQLAAPYAAGVERAQITFGYDGDQREYEVEMTSLGKGVRALGRLLVVHDVTERSLLEKSLRDQALTDSLTGLPNRLLFMARLENAIHRARRQADELFAVIVLDLDRFKFINDTIGHLAGDVLLEGVAAKLKACVREVDSVARMGGDEFMILLHDITGYRDVLPILERIKEELRVPVRFRKQDICTTASIGVVLWDDSYHDPDDMLRAADTAMYQAKEAGRDCYRIFDEPMHKAVLRTMRDENDLRAAIECREFSLMYQPIIDLKTGTVSSLEALVRWRHPQRGLVFPDEFMTVAENSGLVIPLGALILDEACGQLSRWRMPGDPLAGIPVSFNLSARQLTEGDFLSTLLECLEQWRVTPESLIIELTETALIRDPHKSRQVMRELGGIGIRICLDDFGTGSSSLQHLTAFPVQELKIDYAFVSKIATSKTDLEIVRSITALAHTLGLEVTAEGVEYSEQLRLLGSLGCDRGQGYYIGGPMTAGELTDYLEDLQLDALLAGAPGSRARPAPAPAPSGDLVGADDSGPPAWYHPAPLYNKQP